MRWNRFLADLMPLTVGQLARREPLGLDDCVDHPDLFEEFRVKWRAGDLTLQYILPRTSTSSPPGFVSSTSNIISDGLLRQLALNPTPIFQKMLLRDLPPELIHHIMQLAGTHDARVLGSASRYFRGFAMSYIYRVRSLPVSLCAVDSPSDSTGFSI